MKKRRFDFHYQREKKNQSRKNQNPLVAGRVLQYGRKRFQSRAEKLARSPRKLKGTLDRGFEKAGAEKVKKAFGSLLDDLLTLFRFLGAWATRRYTQVGWDTVLKATFAVIYFLSPFDFITDFIPLLGFTDDVMVVSWVVKSIRRELNTFRNWEKGAQSKAA